MALYRQVVYNVVTLGTHAYSCMSTRTCPTRIVKRWRLYVGETHSTSELQTVLMLSVALSRSTFARTAAQSVMSHTPGMEPAVLAVITYSMQVFFENEGRQHYCQLTGTVSLSKVHLILTCAVPQALTIANHQITVAPGGGWHPAHRVQAVLEPQSVIAASLSDWH